jgi:hypothetical protein
LCAYLGHCVRMTNDPVTVAAILDNDQTKLAAILAAKTRALHAALGERCPECGSSKCAADDECGECDSCGATWNHDDLGVTFY